MSPVILPAMPLLYSLVQPFVTARKRSLRRLCFYRCLSVQRGGVLHPGGSPSVGGFSICGGGGSPSGQCAGGTHPTGMHSCCHYVLVPTIWLFKAPFPVCGIFCNTVAMAQAEQGTLIFNLLNASNKRRLHSSRMHTARLFTVSPGMHCMGGCLPRGGGTM